MQASEECGGWLGESERERSLSREREREREVTKVRGV